VRSVLASALVIATTAACSSAPPRETAQVVPVSVPVVRVTESDWPATFELGGIVVARETARIASRILAPIARVTVRPGDRVKRGQALVVLDAEDLGADATRAARASSAAEQMTAAAVADLQAVEAALTLARATHARISALHSSRSATPQELDEARAALVTAEARHRAATARVAESRAGLEAVRAASRAAGITAGFTTLAAPFDGVVIERLADAGSTATPGATLLVLENPASFRLEIRLDATRVPLVRIGQVVPIRLDVAGADSPWLSGRVAEISRIDPAAHSFAAKIDLPADPAWRSGLFGRTRLTGSARRVLTVPSGAVVSRGQLNYVFVVDADDHARLRAVSTGVGDDGRTEVLDGLVAGEDVVARVPPTLKDGTKVTRGAQK